MELLWIDLYACNSHLFQLYFMESAWLLRFSITLSSNKASRSILIGVFLVKKNSSKKNLVLWNVATIISQTQMFSSLLGWMFFCHIKCFWSMSRRDITHLLHIILVLAYFRCRLVNCSLMFLIYSLEFCVHIPCSCIMVPTVKLPRLVQCVDII